MLPLVIALLLHAAEPEHAANPLYASVRREGLTVSGVSARLPDPILHDGQSADEQRAALREVAGSEGALDDLLRNSVTAPFVLKNRSAAYPEGTIRLVDLWFVVYADLRDIHFQDVSNELGKGGSAEAGNMRFEARPLTDDELRAHKLVPKKDLERYVHTRGRLLDRIGVETTTHSYATRSDAALVVASQTAAVFETDKTLPNRWWSIARRDGREERGEDHPYAGGASYVKATALEFKPGALLVEAHVAFVEPKAWFDGAPILRSKISLVAQDQIRRLRREIAQHRKPSRPAPR
jgi:hypothetical protein